MHAISYLIYDIVYYIKRNLYIAIILLSHVLCTYYCTGPVKNNGKLRYLFTNLQNLHLQTFKWYLVCILDTQFQINNFLFILLLFRLLRHKTQWKTIFGSRTVVHRTIPTQPNRRDLILRLMASTGLQAELAGWLSLSSAMCYR